MDEEALRNIVVHNTKSDSAHDIAHVMRVVGTAKKIAKIENGDMDVVTTAAWLHDCVHVSKNSPLRCQASKMSADRAREVLASAGKADDMIEKVCHAIEAHSYSAKIPPQTLEAEIVQDADRLDALGAIGLARCFLVGGSIQRKLYNEHDPLCLARSPDDTQYCIDHFFVKLFKIPESLNTESARQEAESRIAFMQDFLNQLGLEIARDNPSDE